MSIEKAERNWTEGNEAAFLGLGDAHKFADKS